MKHFPCVKPIAVLTCLVLVGLGTTLPANAQLTPDNSLLRIEVDEHGGETVNISVPLGLVNDLYKVMPKEVHEACVQLELTPKTIFKELNTLEGEDLVRITGRDKVRVWFETITEDARKDLNFVTVIVKEDKEEEDGNEVFVRVPKGLVKLAARVIQELGIVDEVVKLPPEVRRALKRVTEKETGITDES